MSLLFYLISLIIHIYILIIIVQVAVSWLISFEVINTENESAKNLVNLLKRATEPVYQPIRKYIPPIGGIDLTPLIVIILLQLLEYVVLGALARALY
jgi:YggT family protein